MEATFPTDPSTPFEGLVSKDTSPAKVYFWPGRS